jgi:hypothetical protein
MAVIQNTEWFYGLSKNQIYNLIEDGVSEIKEYSMKRRNKLYFKVTAPLSFNYKKLKSLKRFPDINDLTFICDACTPQTI